jgi:tetratricopeptide (TPR) repeat protein
MKRARRRWRHAASFAAAAAAIVVVVWWLRRGAPELPGAPVALATAEVRATEGRISYAAADRYRPYEVARAGSGARPLDVVPLGSLAELDRRGDVHGVAAAYLLMNDAERAAAYLDRATPDPGIASDRALVQRATGHLSDALITLDGVLEAAPRHPQALWNRALVLRDLGLSASAAAGFEAVVALHEPGWSDEAHRTAAELSARMAAQRAAFERLAFTDGPRLATVPGGVTEAVARRFPGMTRLRFYDAVRSAGSADAVRALAPLARVLDAVDGGTVLTGYVERIARTEFSRRAPLAHRYAALLAGQRLDQVAARELFAALRAAQQDDILFGALVVVSAGHVPLAQIPELRRLMPPLPRAIATRRGASRPPSWPPGLAPCSPRPMSSPMVMPARSSMICARASSKGQPLQSR